MEAPDRLSGAPDRLLEAPDRLLEAQDRLSEAPDRPKCLKIHVLTKNVLILFCLKKCLNFYPWDKEQRKDRLSEALDRLRPKTGFETPDWFFEAPD